ncbi:hypothetical protein ACI7BZ_18305 [Xanthobacter sp. AM11]|uniref:hypothetical protein n=1 Tax=Xanthobacter sp. AM11 TaxID=3380643 RepID=UPI0039BF4D75
MMWSITDGRGVDVAFDGIGGETLARTLDALRPFALVAEAHLMLERGETFGSPLLAP